jgi:hypothetical protein
MTPAESKLCPRCGNQVEADGRFCKHCAFDLSDRKAVVESKQSNNKIIIGVLGVAVVVLVIALAYLYGTRQVQTTASSFTSNSVSSQTAKQPTSNSEPSDPNALTNERVLAAIRKAFNKLVREEKMAPGANAAVAGIQGIPGASAAKADIDLTNAAFLQTNMLSGKWEVGPGGYGGRMVYSKKRIRIDRCIANLKRYNTGKWVLESIDTHSYEFGVLPVNISVD